MKRLGVVRNPNNPAGNTASLRETAEAIRALSLQIELVDAEAAEDFESAFARLAAGWHAMLAMTPEWGTLRL
jgi:histidinol-phosphate/aromatic aminotransferase/cobyric acid decarboxylase-like protein